jgi:hypothetical protein
MINRRIARARDKFNDQQQQPQQKIQVAKRKEDASKYVVLPYISSICGKLKQIYHNYNKQLVFRPMNKILRQFQSYKEKITKIECGVYMIKCLSCPEIYFGESMRDISKRLYEHMYHLKKGHVEKSAIANHAWNDSTGQRRLDFHKIEENIKLIEYEPRYYHRKFKEGLYIQRSKTKLMNGCEGWSINPIWFTVLHQQLISQTTCEFPESALAPSNFINFVQGEPLQLISQ